MGGDRIGTTAALYRFPVKSMGGERIDSAEIGPAGISGDRAYALLENATGKVVSAKSVRRFPDVLDCSARLLAPPAGGGLPPVEIRLPDGTLVSSDSGDADRVLSAHFGREVTLAAAAPDNFTIDMYHPDIDGADAAGRRDTFVEQKLGAALFAELEMDSPVPAAAFFDVFPVSVITTSTLARLAELAPDSDFDTRRFRMNVIVDTEEDGFVENDWVDRRLGIGSDVRLGIVMPDARCVMVTLAQDGLPRDAGVMRTLVKHNRVQIGERGKSPVAGVYAMVAAGGAVAEGDGVTLA